MWPNYCAIQQGYLMSGYLAASPETSRMSMPGSLSRTNSARTGSKARGLISGSDASPSCRHISETQDTCPPPPPSPSHVTAKDRSSPPGPGRVLWTAGRPEPSAERAASCPHRCGTPASSALGLGHTPPPSATGPPPADAAVHTQHSGRASVVDVREKDFFKASHRFHLVCCLFRS